MNATELQPCQMGIRSNLKTMGGNAQTQERCCGQGGCRQLDQQDQCTRRMQGHSATLKDHDYNGGAVAEVEEELV